ncbi:MAG: preprotein translocase subunit SecE [Patescibacteria group bacterium]
MKKNSIADFFVSVKEEIKKISWPSRSMTLNTTFIVLTATIVVAVYIGLIDYGLSYLIQKFLIS